MKAAALDPAIKKGSSIVDVLIGTFMGRDCAPHRANAAPLDKWLLAGKIKPHGSATYPLQKLGDLLNEIARRKAIGTVFPAP